MIYIVSILAAMFLAGFILESKEHSDLEKRITALRDKYPVDNPMYVAIDNLLHG